LFEGDSVKNREEIQYTFKYFEEDSFGRALLYLLFSITLSFLGVIIYAAIASQHFDLIVAVILLVLCALELLMLHMISYRIIFKQDDFVCQSFLIDKRYQLWELERSYKLLKGARFDIIVIYFKESVKRRKKIVIL
jgi:hypothetical protein